MNMVMESADEAFLCQGYEQFGLSNDGTGDQHEEGPFTGRSINLNRELPELPVNENNPKSLTINTGRPSLTLSSSPNVGSAKPPSSANRTSTVSSKKDFRHLAQGLMNPDSVDSESLSDGYEPLEPTKFNLLDARKPLPRLEEQ
jgi:hypothetical protein